MHRQVWVKVNTPVDEGVSELISLLNQFNRLYTLDSCQGHDGWGFVYFRYGSWLKLAHFVFGRLAPALSGIEEVTFRIQSIDGDEPMAKLGFRTETIPQIVSALKKVISVHRFRCSHGRGRKGLRNVYESGIIGDEYIPPEAPFQELQGDKPMTTQPQEIKTRTHSQFVKVLPSASDEEEYEIAKFFLGGNRGK